MTVRPNLKAIELRQCGFDVADIRGERIMHRNIEILIVDDNQMMAKTLKDILRLKGFKAETANNASEALNKMETNDFDCILSDIRMPDMSGVELIKVIKKKSPNIPMILMTAYTNTEIVREGLEEGTLAVLNKPLNIDRFIQFLEFLGQKTVVAIVDDDPAFCKTLEDILKTKAFKVIHSPKPTMEIEKLLSKGQIILLDMKLNHVNGLEILGIIKENHRNIPVILISGYSREFSSEIEAGLKNGAYTFLDKPLDIEKLFSILNKIRHYQLGEILGNDAQVRFGNCC